MVEGVNDVIGRRGSDIIGVTSLVEGVNDVIGRLGSDVIGRGLVTS